MTLVYAFCLEMKTSSAQLNKKVVPKRLGDRFNDLNIRVTTNIPIICSTKALQTLEYNPKVLGISEGMSSLVKLGIAGTRSMQYKFWGDVWEVTSGAVNVARLPRLTPSQLLRPFSVLGSASSTMTSRDRLLLLTTSRSYRVKEVFLVCITQICLCYHSVKRGTTYIF